MSATVRKPAVSVNASADPLAALAHAKAALAAGTARDTATATAACAAAIDAGLSGEHAYKLLRWLVTVDRERGLDLIHARAVPAGIYDLYDKVFEAAFLVRGDVGGLLRTIDRHIGNPPRPFLTGRTAAAREEAVRMKVPPIFVNTLPKSGTLYLRSALTQILSLPTLRLSVRLFPRDRIVPGYLEMAARGGCLLSEHLDGRRENLDQLAVAGVTRIYVQVRDPRQALISWVHHVADKLDAIYSVGRIDAPPNYRDLSFERRVDWMIARWLPHCVTWIEEWVDVEARGYLTGVNVMVADFAAMRADGHGCVRQLLSHFGLHVEGTLPIPEATEGVNHFRKGELDEWRRVCTPTQQDAMIRAVPAALCERFGWVD